MAPTTHRCEFAECTAEWQTESIETFLELYKIHVRAAHDDGAETSPSAKAERARRPELSSDISDEDWDYFVARWKSYKKATKLTGGRRGRCCCTGPAHQRNRNVLRA